MDPITKFRNRRKKEAASGVRKYAEHHEQRDTLSEEDLARLLEIDEHHDRLCRKYGVKGCNNGQV